VKRVGREIEGWRGKAGSDKREDCVEGGAERRREADEEKERRKGEREKGEEGGKGGEREGRKWERKAEKGMNRKRGKGRGRGESTAHIRTELHVAIARSSSEQRMEWWPRESAAQTRPTMLKTKAAGQAMKERNTTGSLQKILPARRVGLSRMYGAENCW